MKHIAQSHEESTSSVLVMMKVQLLILEKYYAAKSMRF